MRFLRFRRGDTLIEVIFAVSAFAAVMIAGMSIMNMATAKVQSSLQLTMARNAIDSQAEALRFINAVYLANYPDNINSGVAKSWSIVKDSPVRSASSVDYCPKNNQEFGARNAFVVNTRHVDLGKSRNIHSASTFPRLIYGGEEDSNNINNNTNSLYIRSEGLWIEAVKGDKYYDFHIKACWVNPGSTTSTIGTIVRLYDPAI